jgi:hypothetical protein
MTNYDREEEAIIEAENRGEITRAEATKELSELRREYRAAAMERAADAYERELDRWLI